MTEAPARTVGWKKRVEVCLQDLREQARLDFRLGLNGWTVLAVLIGLGLFLPLGTILVRLFREPTTVWGNLASTVLPEYIANSVILAASVGALTIAVGVTAAWLVTTCSFPGRRVFEWALVLPLAIPTYIVAYAYSNILDRAAPLLLFVQQTFGFSVRSAVESGIVYGLLIVILTMVLYPYVYLITRASFLRQTESMFEVSRSLGKGPGATFFRVGLPMARPAIIAGVSLVIMEVLNDYGAVTFFGVPTLTTGIFRVWLSMGEPDAAVRMAACLMCLIFVMLILERSLRGGARYDDAGGQHRPTSRTSLPWAKGLLATSACLIPIALGFLLPVAQLAIWSAQTLAEVVDAEFLRLLRNSFLLALAAGLLTTAVAIFLAYAARLHRTLLLKLITKLALLGYSIPGAVIAVGILIPFGSIDRTVDSWSQAWLGVSPGLLLSGSLAAILFAYLVRFLAVALQSVDSGFERTCRHVDEAARSLGSSPLRTLCRVILPMLKFPIATGAMLVLVDVLKELPLVLILRPFNFDTLATATFGLASEGRIAEAATPALVIVIAGILPVIVLNRIMSQRQPS